MLESSKEQPKSIQNTRKVAWGWWITLLIALILLALALLPGVPAVREWLLGYGKDYVERAGYTLNYQHSSGNLWQGVQLDGVHLQGQGQDIALKSLDIRYFLPAIITGQLPLSIDAQGLSGDINFKTLGVGTTLTPAEENVLPIRPVLKSVNLQDIAIQARDVPFTLPNFSLSNLQIQSKGDLLHFSTTISTAEGSADVEGDMGLAPFSLEADVTRADVTIARQWWQGIEGGTTSGHVSVNDGQVRAEADISDAQIRFMDEVVTNIGGKGILEFPRVRVDLNGNTLGGTITATGGVDIDTSNWFADIAGDVDLKKAALWLAKGRLPFSLEPWPLEGKAQAKVKVSGWVDVKVTGQAVADGTLASLPLKIEQSFFTVNNQGVNVVANGTLADGALAATFKPEDQGIVFDLGLVQAQVLPFAKADGALTIRSGPDGTQGESDIDLVGRLWGRDFNISAEGIIGDDGWENYIDGVSSLNEPIDGAVVLNQGLEGQVNIRQVKIPGASELLELTLAVDGDPASLPLRLTIANPETFDYDIAGVTFPVQGGTITGTMEIPEIKHIQGNLGPIQLQGAVSLNGQDANLSFSAQDIPLSGRLSTTLNLPRGEFLLQEAKPSLNMQIQTTKVQASGLTIAPINGDATVKFDDGLSATLTSPNLDTSYQQGQVKAELKNTEVVIAQQDVVVSGTAQLNPDDLGTLSADIKAISDLAKINLRGQNGQLSFEAKRQDHYPFDLSGTVDVTQNNVDFSGTLMDANVRGTASIQDALDVSMLLEHGQEALRVTVTGSPQDPQLQAKGSLPADVLEPILNIPLSGSLRVDMTRQGGELSGTARLEGSVNDIPVDVDLIGQGNSLTLDGVATPFGQELDLGGVIDLFGEQPTVSIRAEGDIGTFELSRGQNGFNLQGEGITPNLDLGSLELEGQPWSLSGPVNDLSLKVGDSEISIAQAGGLSASGNIRQSFTFRGLELRLEASTTITSDSSVVDGTLTIITPTQQAVFPVSGSLDALNINGTLPAQEVINLAKLPITVAGDIQLGGTVALMGQQPGYEFSGVWQAGQASLPISVSGTGNHFEVRAQNEHLTASYSPAGLELSAHAFDPATFLLTPHFSGLATGQLSWLNGQWSGMMQYESCVPVAANLIFNGLGNTLGLEANYSHQGVHLQASGEVFPSLALNINGSYQDVTTLSGNLSGSLSQPAFDGTLTTKEIIQSTLGLYVPTQQFKVTNDGLKVVLSKEGSSLRLDQNQVEGNITFPLMLQGEHHRVELSLAGKPTLPEVTGNISGKVLQGSFNFIESIINAKLSLNPNPYLQGISLDVPLSSDVLDINLQSDTDLNWQADLLGKAQIDKLPVDISANLTGQGLNYQADAGLRVNGAVIAIKVLGQGSRLQAKADVDYFPLRVFSPYVESQGEMRGYIQFDNQQEQPLEINLRADGQIADQSFSLRSELSPTQPLRISVTQGNASVLIEPKGAQDYSFTLALPDFQHPFLLQGKLTIADVISLGADGQLGIEPLSLEATFNPNTLQGNWLARLSDSSFGGSLERLEDRLSLKSYLELLPNSIITMPIKATLQAQSSDKVWHIENLQVSSALANGQLTGPAFPETKLSGTLELPALSPININLQRNQGYQLDLVQGELNLSTQWSSFTRLESAHIQGQGRLAHYGEASGDLWWQRDSGFTGQLELALASNQQFPLDLQIRATGQGSLELSGHALSNDLRIATLGLSVPADASTVMGRLQLEVDLANLYSLQESVLLKSDLDISGTPLEMGVVGPISLSGAINSQGQVSSSNLFREGKLELLGDVKAVVTYNPEGYNLTANTKDLDLSALFPQLHLPALTSSLSITPSEDKKPVLRSDIQLRINQGLIAGIITVDKTLQGQLNVDANLADLRLGVPLEGLLKGTINLGPTLYGNIAVTGLYWGEDDAYADGNIVVSGPLRSPALSANLTGSGKAGGELLLRLENQLLNLQSTLDSEKLSSNINLRFSPETVQGQGFINVAGYQIDIQSTDGPLLEILGYEKLAGVQASVDIVQKRLSLWGNLNTLNRNLQGQIQLSFNPQAGLSGTLRGALVANLFLGNAEISSSTNTIFITGESIKAQFDTNTRAWTIETLGLSSSSNHLELSGSGTLTTAKLEGFLQSSLVGETIGIPLVVNYDSQGFNIQSVGELPEGYIEILATGTSETGWQGSIKARTLIQGVQVDIQGVIEGAVASPEAVVTTVMVRDGIQISGPWRAGLNGVTFEQSISAEQLKTPLAIKGSLVPLDISISSHGDTLVLSQSQQLVTLGHLDLQWGATTLSLSGTNSGLDLALDLPLPGLKVVTQFSDLSMAGIGKTLDQGILLQGQESTTGSALISLQQGLSVQFDNLSYQSSLGHLSLDGGIRQGRGWYGQIAGTWRGTGQDSDWLPWLATLNRVDFNALLEENTAALIMQGETGSLNATLDRQTSEGLLRADIQLGTGQLQAYVSYNHLGPAGEIILTRVPLYQDLKLSSTLTIDPTAIGGQAEVKVGTGQLKLQGSLGLASMLPPAIVPQGSTTQQLSLRLDNVNAQSLPYINQRLPYLEANLSTFARLENRRWVGQISSPNLKVYDHHFPLAVEFNGPFRNLELRGTLGRNTFNATVDPSHAEGLLSFEQFPLQSVVEAYLGDTDVQGLLWGALRFDIPWNNPWQGYIRFASEHIVLGQDPTQTQGKVSFHIENGGLTIEEANFEGMGQWQARGQLTPQTIDFQMSAREADFTPLLLLFPQLAALGFGASGSLELSTQGSLAAPQATLISPSLDISIGGSSYRLQDTLISLRQGRLNAQSQLIGLKPIGGNLTILGQGSIQLNPAQANISFRTSGSANVPALGEVEDIDATIRATEQTPWYLDFAGRLGNPFAIKGSLAPLDITLEGRDLNLQAKERFLDSSQADVNMRLRYDQGLILSGSIFADQVFIKLGQQEQATESTIAQASIQPTPNRFLERVFFDSITIQAPQQINFEENFGKGELGANVILTGTAARPELSGEAQIIRGSLNFRNLIFRIDTATADFQPSRGIYPNISISATSSVEKTTALRGNSEVSFVEPAGPTFDIFLDFTGELLAKEGGGFGADLNPTLSSNAVIATSAGQRALTENELYSLITLGNLQLAETITGEGSVTESVAQGALDTAVDYFILSELQNQLGQALGLDLFEVRTTTLSSLLSGSESFGVALRIGGYLRDDLFASYEIRTLDLDPDVALANEFTLRYDFSPLELDLTGRLNVLRQASLTPLPELSIGLGYAVSPLLRIQGGVDISQQEQSLRFGISLRW